MTEELDATAMIELVKRWDRTNELLANIHLVLVGLLDVVSELAGPPR
jgi:hypothetical protein